MNPPIDNRRRLPGTLFLKVARLIFAEQLIESVFSPAVADYRQELEEAGRGRVEQLTVCGRWYWAFLSLIIVVPLSMRTSPITGRSYGMMPRLDGAWLLVLLAAALCIGSWRFFGSFVIGATAAGALLALGMRVWRDGHPSGVVEPGWWAPPLPVQINLSSMPVAGDGPGIVVAVGTVLIVVVGLPGLWWFYVAAGLGSLLVAVGLVIRRLPEHS